jgi:hypothetical protein
MKKRDRRITRRFGDEPGNLDEDDSFTVTTVKDVPPAKPTNVTAN